MTIDSFLRGILYYIILLPSSIMCYLPMKNKLKFSVKETTLIVLLGNFIIITLSSIVTCLFNITNLNIVLLPAIIVCYIIFHFTTTTSLSKKIFVVTSICCLCSFASFFAYMCDCVLNPTLSPEYNTIEYDLFQLGFTFLFGLMLLYFMSNQYSWMIDNIDIPKVWNTAIIFPILLTALTIYSVPKYYKTMHVGRVFPIAIAMFIVAFILYIAILWLFYTISKNITETNKIEEKNHILEIHNSQYKNLQHYMEETSKLRHDFKHSIHMMNILANEGNIDEIKKHLSLYEEKLNIQSPKKYCFQSSINALLNYYNNIANNENIKTNWNINIPKEILISDFDLCNLLGNICDNAIRGSNSEEKEKYFNLKVDFLNNRLYIVSSNNFDGYIEKENDKYISTKKVKSGVGIFSMESVAEKYNGIAEIINNDNKFMVNVMLNNIKNK